MQFLTHSILPVGKEITMPSTRPMINIALLIKTGEDPVTSVISVAKSLGPFIIVNISISGHQRPIFVYLCVPSWLKLELSIVNY
ncbi:MAG: hypothetical protein JSV88_19165 [Candidatus Aminicenantes bacterium]|nr:MAG: hypothetical protein JSV88_19165 [Candidatus Aminicenantes bacterium]